jgi:transposase
MDREQAERIYKAGRRVAVETLLQLAARIRELEQTIAHLSRNSTNSSKPPSTDPPGVKKPKTDKKPGTRRQGGQPGHKGKKRKLLPASKMDAIHDIFPQECEHCRSPLSQSLLDPAHQPLRHQVFELPRIVPLKTEYRLHSLLCSCGRHTVARLPREVANSSFGPRLHAAIAYLTAVHRVSRRGIAEIMTTLFGIEISTGAVCKANNRVSEACEPAVGALKRYVASATTLNIDETGWKNKGARRYLWCFVAPMAVLFHISESRGAKVLKEILGETFTGIIGSDDHSAYNGYHKHGLRQLCWAHLIRKLKALRDDGSSRFALCFAKNMLKEIGSIFAFWHAFQESGGSRCQWQPKTVPVLAMEKCTTREQLWLATAPMRRRMYDYCDIFLDCPDEQVRTRAKRTLANWQYLFTFLRYEGVEPTNNIAERAIRPSVQWRKLCFGSQSDTGERFTERLLSVIGTCRMHGVNPFHFLTEVVSAAFSCKRSLPDLPHLLQE